VRPSLSRALTSTPASSAKAITSQLPADAARWRRLRPWSKGRESISRLKDVVVEAVRKWTGGEKRHPTNLCVSILGGRGLGPCQESGQHVHVVERACVRDQLGVGYWLGRKEDQRRENAQVACVDCTVEGRLVLLRERWPSPNTDGG